MDGVKPQVQQAKLTIDSPGCQLVQLNNHPDAYENLRGTRFFSDSGTGASARMCST